MNNNLVALGMKAESLGIYAVESKDPRIVYFYNDGEEEVYLASADWMRRNLNRRIETAFPILDASIRQMIIDILHIQLKDNVKACWIDEKLQNVPKKDDSPVKVRAQMEIFNYLREKKDNLG